MNKNIEDMVSELIELQEKLKDVVIRAEVTRVIGKIEEILSKPINYYVPTNLDPSRLIDSLCALNYDCISEEQKRKLALKILDDTQFEKNMDEYEAVVDVYGQIEQYIDFLARVKANQYKNVKQYFKIGEDYE